MPLQTPHFIHRDGWSIGPTAYATSDGGIAWAVDGWNGENVIRADGPTEAEAWRAAVDQAVELSLLGRRIEQGQERFERTHTRAAQTLRS